MPLTSLIPKSLSVTTDATCLHILGSRRSIVTLAWRPPLTAKPDRKAAEMTPAVACSHRSWVTCSVSELVTACRGGWHPIPCATFWSLVRPGHVNAYRACCCHGGAANDAAAASGTSEMLEIPAGAEFENCQGCRRDQLRHRRCRRVSGAEDYPEKHTMEPSKFSIAAEVDSNAHYHCH